ncbi:MAG: hypothetical protein JW967_01545 [Dehalococcoidales bacterium]|nr:hypothetical protein [Dehalococcoidales bacterium]
MSYPAQGVKSGSSFIKLTDTPQSYADQTYKSLRVKSELNGLEFFDPSALGGQTPTIDVPITWTKNAGNPIFIGTRAGWEAHGVASPSIVKTTTQYLMFYQGDAGGGAIKIGVATCPLISFPTGPWTPYAGNPVLTVGAGGSWDSLWVSNPKAWLDGSTFYMFYEGNNGVVSGIGYATSPDGFTWTKYVGNPVVQISADPWESKTVGTPQIIKVQNTYCLYYHGGQDMGAGYIKDQIGLAYSLDLNTWTKETRNPLVSVGVSGAWDDYKVGAKCVFKMSNGYMMIYEGFDGTTAPDTKYWKLGLATSPSLISWTKYASNPIISGGGAGSWDEERVSNMDIYYDGTTYYLFYTGGNTTLAFPDCNIGLATATVLTGIALAGYLTSQNIDIGSVYINGSAARDTATVGNYQLVHVHTSHGALNDLIFTAKIPADWDGVSIPTLHWLWAADAAGAGNIKFVVFSQTVSNGRNNDFTPSVIDAGLIVASPGANIVVDSYLPYTTLPTVTDGSITFRLRRDGVSGDDTFASTIRFMSIWISYAAKSR